MGVAPFCGGGFNKEYRALRTNRYTYVRGLQGPWLLYDDEKDPFQLTNLAAARNMPPCGGNWTSVCKQP